MKRRQTPDPDDPFLDITLEHIQDIVKIGLFMLVISLAVFILELVCHKLFVAKLIDRFFYNKLPLF